MHVVACDHLATHTLQYQNYAQKGFTGTCCYEIDGDLGVTQKLTMLAEFAHYASIGYRTTWGMGQTRLVEQERIPEMPMQGAQMYELCAEALAGGQYETVL